MLENQGNNLLFVAHYVKDGDAVTALAVTVNIYEVTRTGVTTQLVNAGACTEIGHGLYRYILAAAQVDEDAEYPAVFHTDGDVDQADIPAMWSVGRAGTPNLDAPISGLPSAADNADAVWDEAIAGHLNPGTTGLALRDASLL